MSEAANQGETPSIRPNHELISDHYILRVKEHLSPHWSKWFEGLTVAYTATGETLLHGSIPDQSALHGLLARIRDLNLTLISASRVEMEPPVESEGPSEEIFEGEQPDKNVEESR